MGNYHALTTAFVGLDYHDPAAICFLTNYRGQFAQQQLARGDSFRQPQGQQLHDCVAPQQLLRSGLIKFGGSSFRTLQVKPCAQFAEDVYRPRQMLGSAFGLGHGISAAQFIVRARTAIAITQQIENRNAAAEVLSSHRCITPRHLYQPV